MYTFFQQKLFKTFPVVSLCVAVLSISGCWDRKEVNDIALVIGAALDATKDNKIELTVQMIVPRAVGGGQGEMGGGGGEESKQKTFVRSEQGTTIADAMTLLQEKIPRKIFWGHLKGVIISQELAKKGIRDQIDFIARYPEPRLRTYVFVSKGQAQDQLKILPPLERSSVDVLRELANFQFGARVTLKDLLEMLSSESEGALLPWIEEVSTKMDSGETAGKETVPGLRINGTAVFKNGKMIGHIDNRLTRGILWIRNEIKFATITYTPKDTNGFVSMYHLRSQSDLIPRIENEKWNMRIKIESEEDVIQNTTNLNMINPEVIKKLEKESEEHIKERINMTLDQVQKKMKTDIFGFADAYERKYPAKWDTVKDRWDQVFPDVEVQIETKVRIRRPGVSTLPPAMPQKEVREK